MRNWYIKISILLSLLASNYCQGQSNVESIQREADTLNYLFKTNIQIKIRDEGNIISTPNKEIVIGTKQFNKIISVGDSQQKLFLIRLILLHEFAHQMQFDKYKNNSKVINNDPIFRTLIEAQADMLAGYYWIHRSYKLIDGVSIHQEEAQQILNKTFQLIYDLGIKENFENTHPSKSDRLLALTTGLAYGYTVLRENYIIKLDDKEYIQSLGGRDFLKKEYFEIRRFLDYMNNDNLYSWSYRQAKKIINYDRSISKNIVLINEPKIRIKWDTSHINPFATYNLVYKNIGAKSIYMEMEVYMAHKKRNEVKGGFSLGKVNVNHYKFLLKPGQIFVAKDRLNWLKNDFQPKAKEMYEDEFPSLVFPGGSSTNQVYSCAYTEEIPTFIDGSEAESFGMSEAIITDYNFSIFFKKIVKACRFNLENTKRGIGTMTQLNLGTEIYQYNSSIQFADESQTVIEHTAENAIVTIITNFPINSIRSNTVSLYLKIKAALKNELPDVMVKSTENDQLYYSLFDGKNMTVTMFIDGTEKQSTVILTILLFPLRE